MNFQRTSTVCDALRDFWFKPNTLTHLWNLLKQYNNEVYDGANLSRINVQKIKKWNSISCFMLNTHDHSKKIVVLQGDISIQKQRTQNVSSLKTWQNI